MNESAHIPDAKTNSTLDNGESRSPANSGGSICASCAQLNVGVDKFIINEPTSKPGRTIKGSGRSSILKTSSSRVKLGTLAEIRKRACPICQLVCHSTTTSEHQGLEVGGDPETIECFANWEVDGRQVILNDEQQPCGYRNLTRRIHLEWSTNEIQDSYLVLVSQARHTQPNSDAPRSWGRQSLFLGRELEGMGKNQALINSWLESCDERHGEKCHVQHDQAFFDLIEKSYFGVIDVQDMCLTSLPRHEKYVALSYVWGVDKRFRTLLSNVLLHKAHGGLEANMEQLPQTILDAIEVCRRLGSRYLWVDSLCIVQDSIRSWKLNAASMDIIYGNAHLTICAADGLDATAGLRAMHASSTDHKYTDQKIIECLPGLKLMISRLAEAGIERSVWNTRAWTFCERILSKRCLIFTQGRVYFQCRSTAMSEDVVAEPEGAGWSLGLIRAPLQLLKELKPSRRPFWVYMNCVELYSKRELTYSNDILNAFGGISNLLAEKMDCTMIFGLPSSHFDLAMLWTASKPLVRRLPRTEKEIGQYAGDEFPSWSWAGWMADAADTDPSSATSYCPEMLEGSLANPNEFLTQKTWIHWYIRDGHGDLRPIWTGATFLGTEDNRPKGNFSSSESDYSSPPPRSRSRVRKHRRDGNRDTRAWYGDHPPRFIGREVEEIVVERGANDDPMDDSKKISRRPPPYQPPEVKRPDVAQRVTQEVANRWDGYTTYYAGPGHDVYGRRLKDEDTAISDGEFHRTVPEHPFGVNVAKQIFEPSVTFPDQRYLQFHTWSTYLRLERHEARIEGQKPCLARYDIADAASDWCGTIVLDDHWAQENIRPNSQHEFLAISEAKSFTEEENDVWTYYIPKEREQSEWDLFFVLLVQQGRGGIAQRVGLGKVFKSAFQNRNSSFYPHSEWREIILE